MDIPKTIKKGFRLKLFNFVAKILRIEYRFAGFTNEGEKWGDRWKR
jgi:hypothetical protein